MKEKEIEQMKRDMKRSEMRIRRDRSMSQNEKDEAIYDLEQDCLAMFECYLSEL